MNQISKTLLIFFVTQSIQLSLPAYVFSEPVALVFENEAELRERFFSEAPTQLIRYRENYFYCNGTRKFKRTHVTSGRVENREGGCVIRGNRKCKLVETELPDGSQTAMGGNPYYLFLVKKKHSKDFWYLDKLQVKQPPKPMVYDPEFVDNQVNLDNLHSNFQSTCGAAQLSTVSEMNFAQMIHSDAFKLKSIKSESSGKFVEATISYEFEGAARIEGKITMCPEQYWTIRKYDLDVFKKVNGGFKLYGKQTFESTVANEESFVLPVSTIVKGLSYDGNNETMFLSEYELTESHNLAESECRLSAYGLPDPPELNRIRTRKFWWLVSAAGFVLVVAVLYFRSRNIRSR